MPTEESGLLIRDDKSPDVKQACSSFLKAVHTFLMRATGVNARRLFEDALASNVSRLLEERLANSRHRELLEDENLESHYADIELADSALRNVLLSFIAARIEFIEECLGPEEIERSSFMDIGDSSGIFLRALKKRGTGVNCSEKAARNLYARGVRAVQGDGMRLPFSDAACDYVFCFETLEHLPNPFGGLVELWRICRKGAFISVPQVGRTTVYPPRFRNAPQELLHIFELSPPHWNALIAHTPFTMKRSLIVPVMGPPRGIKETAALSIWRLLFEKDVFCGTFKRFWVYYLSKHADTEKRSR